MNAISKDAISISADELRGRLTGDYVTPEDPNWDEARLAWNLAVDQRPAAVAIPETVEDIVEVVRYARSNGLRVAGQSTGHNAHTLAPGLAQTVLVKTHRMRRVQIDADSRVARVEPGTLWMDVTYPAGEYGLAPLAGSSPDVGVAGYVLGGGISWLARKYGLATNSVIAIELVNADGEHIRASSVENSDLFWALRGGGGSFGIVTSIELRLFPVQELYAGWLIFPMERAEEVLNAWREWVEHVPDEVTSIGRLLQVPPLPDIPEPLRGRRLVVVEAAMIMDEAAASKLLKPLRKLGPEIDTFATKPAAELQELHMDPPQPVPGLGDHMLLRDLTPAGIEKVVAVAGAGSPSPLVSVEFRHLGGALGRVEPGNGATAMLDAGFAMFAVGLTMDPVMTAAVRAYLPVVTQALARYDSGREYLNFAEQRTDVRRLWPADTYRRLRAVKAEHDPLDIFRSNHPVPPAQS
ncbi:MAG TPA: FAD-binding oxidoreductase [Thermoleophilaceae bacterium]|nr:FAD-binding oxidoreductase [Thermoleophilaceae bacterium]